MQNLDERTDPITDDDLNDPGLQAALGDLQGNILCSHGRERSVHIFLRFLDKEQGMRWIAEIAPHITPAQKQIEEAKAYNRGSGTPGEVFWSFFLSAHGYEVLGIPDQYRLTETAFGQGMPARQSSVDAPSHQTAGTLLPLNDPPQATWDEGYRDPQRRIDAMLLLADKDERNLPWEDLAGQKLSPAQQVEALRTWLGNFGIHAVPEVCAIEYGRVLRNAQCKSIEHFGYVDVGSEPLFFQKDVDEVQENEGIDRWNPGAGPDLVLVKEPNSLLYNQGKPTYGSYFVFRKLEQDVSRFDDYLRALQTGLGLQGHDRARAEALVMGRFRDGTPVVLQRTPGTSDSLLNNFDFRNDPVGMRCPFQAHIRRMNPRGERDRGIRGAIAEAIRKLLPGKAQREYERIRRDPAAALRRLSVEEQGKEERIILSDLAKALERLSVDGQREVDRIQNAVDGKYDERRHRIARRSMPYGKQGEPVVAGSPPACG